MNYPVEIHRLKVNKTIEEFESLRYLDKKPAKKLKWEEVRTPQFKMSSIIHNEGNPGQPAVS